MLFRSKTSEMVKIPKLAEDGQNWKIYCAKFLEVTATFDCLKVLAGRPYKGEDWDGCNALLCCMFMETVALSIYFKIRHRTAHENFKYLAKRFRDNEPIPRANELQCAGTAAAAEMPKKSPTSTNAATEWHASAEQNKEDLITTQALTRGTKSIDDGNIGRTQDPHMSTEALAEGTSAKHAETTPVMLKSVLPHEMQNRPQNSLPLTLRLPIDGEPCRCKQEAVDSIVTAGCTNGMVKMANLPETIADVDRTAPLGGKPAERARGVDEGDGMEREPQSRLQQTIFYSKEDIQRNANINENVPNAYGLPLKGEWEVCASGEARDPRSSTNAPNATPECVHRPSELSETKDAEGVESEGCEGGTGEPTELLTMSVEPYIEDSGDIPHVHLGGTWMRPGDTNGPGCQADRLRGPTDVLRSWTDTLNMSNSAGTAGLGHSDDLGTYLSITDAKHVVLETDDDRCHADALTGQTDVLSIEMNLTKPVNEMEIVRTRRKMSET